MKLNLATDVLIQVYDESGLRSLALKAGTVDVDDDDLALLAHYASSTYTVADEAPVVAPAPSLSVADAPAAEAAVAAAE